MTDHFVYTDALRTHAGAVHAVSDAIRSAGTTGTGVDLGLDTYGIIGQFFSLGARLSIATTGDSISGFADEVAAFADAVTATADLYDRTEDDNTVAFGGEPR